MKKFITAAGICCALPLIIIGAVWFAAQDKNQNQGTSSGSSQLPLQGKEIPVLGRNHVSEGTIVEHYNSNPPTSGNHWPTPAEWGFYNTSLPDEQLVHNLEHGGIWISYKDIDDVTKTKLLKLAQQYPQAVIVTPRSENDAKIAVASWGRLEKLDAFDEEKIIAFIRGNINRSPEKLASLGSEISSEIKVGNTFPDFMVNEVGGKEITRDSLRGKPAIVWFTTSWCVPCQIGARDVAKVDNELGGKAFDVLVVFVDPRESKNDLINWRKRFANKDWMVAFDNETTLLAQKINLRFLDSKFLLDKNGVIKNIDFKIADEAYLNVIRKAVAEN